MQMQKATLTQEQADFLDGLRASGRVNMFGAAVYLARAFKMDSSDAQTILQQWMDSYGKDMEAEKTVQSISTQQPRYAAQIDNSALLRARRGARHRRRRRGGIRRTLCNGVLPAAKRSRRTPRRIYGTMRVEKALRGYRRCEGKPRMERRVQRRDRRTC